jgi:hypothetical protein
MAARRCRAPMRAPDGDPLSLFQLALDTINSLGDVIKLSKLKIHSEHHLGWRICQYVGDICRWYAGRAAKGSVPATWVPTTNKKLLRLSLCSQKAALLTIVTLLASVGCDKLWSNSTQTASSSHLPWHTNNFSNPRKYAFLRWISCWGSQRNSLSRFWSSFAFKLQFQTFRRDATFHVPVSRNERLHWQKSNLEWFYIDIAWLFFFW